MLQDWLKNVFLKGVNGDISGAIFILGLSFLLGMGMALLAVCFVIRVRKKKEEIAPRRIEFTLPDRENAYVRARLATVLQPEGDEQETGIKIDFSHARMLLHRIWFASLSPAERLEMDGLEDTLDKYANVTQFKEQDVRVINDAFARLLKLSAKHDVEL